MQSKRIILLIIILVISLGYSWLSLFVFENDLKDDFSYQGTTKANKSGSIQGSGSALASSNLATESMIKPVNKGLDNTSSDEPISLPETFILVGAKPRSEDDKGKALLEYKGDLLELQEGDLLVDSSMRLTQIKRDSVNIEYRNKTFTISLTPPNLLAPDYKKPDKTRAELLEMTPKQIGSRPRIIEHLFILTPTPYIADGKLVNPGLNPTLFKSAGFQDDDVLKTINGKSVTIEHEFEEIKNELKSAQTLTFTVMRKGRTITLYLDIPSEALKLSLD